MISLTFFIVFELSIPECTRVTLITNFIQAAL